MTEQTLEPIKRLTRDLARSGGGGGGLSRDEAAILVTAYYTIQEHRIAMDAQKNALTTPHAVLAWFFKQFENLEKQIVRPLDAFSATHPAGQWARGQFGVGPVIAAGLLAHLDIEKAPHVGHFWAFAGLAVGQEWKKGEKRPWNAELKTLCWKLGQSFMKFSNAEQCYYGKIYRQWKAREIERNEAGEYRAQAAGVLERKRIGKATEAYKAYSQGRLPPAHLDARARRYAVKLFLSHFHEIWHVAAFGRKPAPAYALAVLGHADYIQPPEPIREV